MKFSKNLNHNKIKIQKNFLFHSAKDAFEILRRLQNGHSPSISIVNIRALSCLFRLTLQEQRDILHGLRQAAFETESENSLSNERRRSLCAKEFKKLGFSVSYCLQVMLWCFCWPVVFHIYIFFLPCWSFLFRTIVTLDRIWCERLRGF